MRNIIAFIARYHFIILFVILEAIALILFSKSSYYQQTVMYNGVNEITGRFYDQVTNLTDYIKLKKINEQLANENAMLRQMTSSSFLKNDTASFWKNDTLYKQQYRYIVANVNYNTIGKPNNYIMIDKGSLMGVEKDMGVITSNGVVGTVVQVSKNFSWVMSLLNKNSKVSGRIAHSDQIGTVIWNGLHYSFGTLTDVPAHSKIKRGDTIVTSGYSNTFPAGITIGIIKDYRIESGEDFFVIPFKFSVDFNALQHVYIVKNLLKKQQDTLMKVTEGQKNE